MEAGLGVHQLILKQFFSKSVFIFVAPFPLLLLFFVAGVRSYRYIYIYVLAFLFLCFWLKTKFLHFKTFAESLSTCIYPKRDLFCRLKDSMIIL